MGSPGLLASLSIFNASVEFESLQELLERTTIRDQEDTEITLDKETMQDLSNYLSYRDCIYVSVFEHSVADLAPVLNMSCDHVSCQLKQRQQYKGCSLKVKDLYNDFQTTLCGIAKIEATSTLGLHVCLTMKNVNFFCSKYPGNEMCCIYFF